MGLGLGAPLSKFKALPGIGGPLGGGGRGEHRMEAHAAALNGCVAAGGTPYDLPGIGASPRDMGGHDRGSQPHRAARSSRVCAAGGHHEIWANEGSGDDMWGHEGMEGMYEGYADIEEFERQLRNILWAAAWLGLGGCSKEGGHPGEAIAQICQRAMARNGSLRIDPGRGARHDDEE